MIDKLSRGLGKLQKRIIEYADSKAKRTDPTLYMTAIPYVTAHELSKTLNASPQNVCKSVRVSVKRGLLRVFPSGRKEGRCFGSMSLPEFTESDLKAILRVTKIRQGLTR